MPLNPSGIFYADTSTEMSVADITAAMATSISTIINDVITTAVPAGIIAQTAATAAPSGWLLCQGQAVSRTTYAGLYAAIGTNYGTGDGSSTFNLPDLQGRVPVGKAGSGTFSALNAKGGAETIALTIDQMPSHSHTINDPGHEHYVNTAYYDGAGNYLAQGNQNLGSFANNATTGVDTTGISINANGGNQAHSNLQPYIVTNFIIKF